MSKGRLQYLRDMGHGDCLEAISLEENPHVRLQLLHRYVSQKQGLAAPQKIRKARRMIDSLKNFELRV